MRLNELKGGSLTQIIVSVVMAASSYHHIYTLTQLRPLPSLSSSAPSIYNSIFSYPYNSLSLLNFFAMLTIAFVLLSLNLLAATTPVDRGQRGDNRIWLRKTSTVSGKVKETIVNVEQVLSQLLQTYEYVHRCHLP